MKALYYTPAWEGYYMSQEQEKRVKADTLLEYHEARQRLNVLKQRARELAHEFLALGNSLQNDPTNIAVESYSEVLKFDACKELISDVRKAEKAMGEARAEAAKLGIDPSI